MNFFILLPILEKLFMSFKLGGNNASPLIFFFPVKVSTNVLQAYLILLHFT